jgi:polyisoprenoid-binding protein YceI
MATWKIDPLHSDVHFKVRHLVISSVTGEFKKFEGTVEADDDDFSHAKIKFSADTDSIYTNNEKRDEDLRHEDFFNVAKFPKLTFESTIFGPLTDNEHLLRGNLTIKGGTKPVDLKVIYGGRAMDREGRERAGFEVTGIVNRYDYGLIWSLLTESGAIILSEDVKIHANIELIKVSD